MQVDIITNQKGCDPFLALLAIMPYIFRLYEDNKICDPLSTPINHLYTVDIRGEGTRQAP